MDKVVKKWAAGISYGPILSQTDLYLLQTELEINPILLGKTNKPLQFHLLTGFASNPQGGDPDHNFVGKTEPAVLPRVSQIILISKYSPWCTIVKNDLGITIGDLCTELYKDYTNHDVTDAEFSSLPQRAQDQLKRTASHNFQNLQPQQPGGWGGYYAPQQAPDRIRRVDWLRERLFFEGIERDDHYVQSRLGFKAPNVYVLDLAA